MKCISKWFLKYFFSLHLCNHEKFDTGKELFSFKYCGKKSLETTVIPHKLAVPNSRISLTRGSDRCSLTPNSRHLSLYEFAPKFAILGHFLSPKNRELLYLYFLVNFDTLANLLCLLLCRWLTLYPPTGWPL